MYNTERPSFSFIHILRKNIQFILKVIDDDENIFLFLISFWIYEFFVRGKKRWNHLWISVTHFFLPVYFINIWPIFFLLLLKRTQNVVSISKWNKNFLLSVFFFSYSLSPCHGVSLCANSLADSLTVSSLIDSHIAKIKVSFFPLTHSLNLAFSLYYIAVSENHL